MKSTLFFQPDRSLISVLKEVAEDLKCHHLGVCVAYATDGILETFKANTNYGTSRWLIGLDDGVSSPNLLTQIQGDVYAELRVAFSAPKRFHPKVYLISGEHGIALIVGSNNATSFGTEFNDEAFCLLTAETDGDIAQLTSFFESLWERGNSITDNEIHDYKLARNELQFVAKNATKKAEQKLSQFLVGIETNGTGFWIDIGSAMSSGREIEFPKKVADFFAVDGELKKYDFPVSGAADTKGIATFIYREDNGMWRIAIPRTIEGATDLRSIEDGKHQRSTKAVLFKRKADNALHITFCDHASPEYEQLISRSKSNGTFGKSSSQPGARSFGFL